ncbi:MAG TPA: hypothetical protein PLV07_04660 [Acidiphilium sp.]|uniref:hypothetical protein n=1 Tax=unclassified Acidiphilium TaxID=2617493 RepID=UPI0025BE14F4|nr:MULTISPECIES: hypothetical protein [unclassified Acidiphilium]HQT59795.1 hypothetical protein [Acidiphilium sp.]HQU10853.1 hypothetical protein [Acidiphilium sp.]
MTRRNHRSSIRQQKDGLAMRYRPRLTARCQGLGLRDEGVRLHDVCKTPPSLEMTQNNPALAALVRARPVEVMI